MFKTRTLFIVGAGASDEAGLPVGAKLKERIAHLVNIKFDDWGQKVISGDYRIVDALRVLASNSSYASINPYLHEGRAVSNAMPQALSIDNFLDAHMENSSLQQIGKLGITKAILDAERVSRLSYKFPERPDLSQLGDTWYSAFFQLLTENVRKTDLGNLFKNVSFVTFNYDRCIQTFMYYALQNYYRVSEKEASEIVSTLTVLHPFGSVGRLNWEDARGIAFGADIGGQRLLEQSKQIKTFSERIEDEEALVRIRNQVQRAETIVSLGFAFHKTNMELLRPQESSVSKIYATALNFSASDVAQIDREWRLLLSMPKRRIEVALHNGLKCAGLFKEYWRTMSQ